MIGVISDTHELVRPEVCDILKGVDLIIHAGDIGSAEVFALEAIAPVKAVVAITTVTHGPITFLMIRLLNMAPICSMCFMSWII